MINIYDYNNTLLLHLCNEDETEAVVSDNIQSIPLNEGSVYSHTLMGEDSISLKFSLDNPIKLTVGSYVKDSSLGAICKNNPLGWFVLCENATPTYNQTTGGYDYDIKFNAWYFFWNRYILKLNPQYGAQESSFTLTSTIDEHFKVLKENINRYFASSGLNRYDGFDVECVVYNNVDNSAKPISYDAVHITDALTTIAQAYDCEWWIESNIVYFGKCDKTIDDPIELEVGKEIASISSSKSSSIYSTRLYAFGSTRNISARYRKPHTIDTTIYSFEKRLMLPIDKCPMNYVDSDTIKDEYGNVIEKKIEESVIVFDDVYPKKEVKIKKVETEDEEITEEETSETRNVTHYRFFVDKDDFWFDEEYLMPEKTLSIIFQTGKLAGMEFELENFNKYVEGTNYQSYEIIINSNYSVDLPNSTLYPSVDDVIIFFNYDASLLDDESNTLVRSAEEELYQKTLDYLKVSEIDDNTYDVTLSADYAYGVINNGDLDKSNAKILSLGDSVTLKDESKFDEKGRTSRVIGIEVKLDVPYDSPTYSIGESKAYSRIGELEGKIEGVKTSSSSSIGGGGGMSANTVESIIKNNGGKYFISKLKDDTAEGHILFKKGLVSNGDVVINGNEKISGDIEFDNTTKGVNGAHIWHSEDGWHIQTDYLDVFNKATFAEIETQKVSHVGGQMLLTAAYCKDVRVEQIGDDFKVLFYAKDKEGTLVENLWEIDDIAYCQTFNIVEQSDGKVGNRYYKYVVKEVGTTDNGEFHYIVLDGANKALLSDAPIDGDTLVQLGNVNDSQVNRQSAILIQGAGSNAPSILEFANINSFELPNPETQIKPNNNIFTGQVILKSDSKFDDGTLVKDAINVESSTNLLRNTSFKGDGSTIVMKGDIASDQSTYSPSLEHWEFLHAFAEESLESKSGFVATLIEGNITQVLAEPVKTDERYVLSFKAKGESLTFSVGGYAETVVLSDVFEKKTIKFKAVNDGTVFSMKGSCSVCEVMFTKGNVVSSWCESRYDVPNALNNYENLNMQYLKSALSGSTSINGGLVLSNLLMLGKEIDNNGNKEITAGINGLRWDNNSVAQWGGGSLEQAIYTVAKYLNNPNFTPTEEELANMAMFVVTHGGRAILNDVIARGTIYATDGVFKGTIYAKDGEFQGAVRTYNDEGKLISAYNGNGNGTIVYYYPKTNSEREPIKLREDIFLYDENDNVTGMRTHYYDTEGNLKWWITENGSFSNSSTIDYYWTSQTCTYFNGYSDFIEIMRRFNPETGFPRDRQITISFFTSYSSQTSTIQALNGFAVEGNTNNANPLTLKDENKGYNGWLVKNKMPFMTVDGYYSVYAIKYENGVPTQTRTWSTGIIDN